VEEKVNPAGLVATVSPNCRSVQMGTPTTVFATVANGATVPASGVRISLETQVPVRFSFQTVDPATKRPTGTPNTPTNIPAGGPQTFVLTLVPLAVFAPTELSFNFCGTNSAAAPTVAGVNTLVLSASSVPVPDIIAQAVTASGDGVVDIPGATGTGLFVVSTVNLRTAGTITVSADTGGATLPVNLFVSETNPTTGECLADPEGSVSKLIGSSATSTFAVFVQGAGPIPFDPVTNRVFVRFRDVNGAIRGLTSVAVRTV
jgi:hypothetical protein